MKEIFSNHLKQFRKSKNLSQEQLADMLGITTQAVSKWECNLSYPDVELLTPLADALEVSVDALLRENPVSDNLGQPAKGSSPADHPCAALKELPDDNVLRFVQCIGNKVIQAADGAVKTKIPIMFPETANFPPKIEIWGSAEIEGDIFGGVNAGGNIACADISGGANAGGDITCADTSGGVNAGGNITCADISGGANAGIGITCADISGGAYAGKNISCADISGDINAGGDVQCETITECRTITANGDIKCEGDIYCKTIAQCKTIEGNVKCEGDIHIENCE